MTHSRPTCPAALPAPLVAHFPLDPSLCFLNHGSFGSTPHQVARIAESARLQLERDPVDYFVHRLEPLLDEARRAMAHLIGCPPSDLAFVDNATAGVSTVVSSLRFQPGDEVLVTSHEYNACANAIRRAADRHGLRIITAHVPWPTPGPAAVVQALLAAATPRTRLALVSAITSPTGLVWPYADIVRALAASGIDTLLDAAHAPGHIPLDIASVGCAYATGNFHKWLCAPKGSAFLYVRPDRQHLIEPLITSHGRNAPPRDTQGRSRFRLNFDYVGTLDYARWLATPACAPLLSQWAAELGQPPGGRDGLDGFRAHNRQLALGARAALLAALGTEPPCPESMVGSMAAVMLPPHPPQLDEALAARPTLYADALQDALLERHRVQVPIIRFPGLRGRWVRISAMLYNRPQQYEHLADALREELHRERTL